MCAPRSRAGPKVKNNERNLSIRLFNIVYSHICTERSINHIPQQSHYEFSRTLVGTAVQRARNALAGVCRVFSTCQQRLFVSTAFIITFRTITGVYVNKFDDIIRSALKKAARADD